MGKRFEGANLSALDVVNAYLKFGLGNLLGTPGEHTVIEQDRGLTSETIDLYCLPGKMSSNDFTQLMIDAGLIKRSHPQAA